MNTNGEKAKCGEIPLPILKSLLQDEFVANMVAVAKEFNLCVFWRKEDKDRPALRMPWR